jgi:hypothetical protein
LLFEGVDEQHPQAVVSHPFDPTFVVFERKQWRHLVDFFRSEADVHRAILLPPKGNRALYNTPDDWQVWKVSIDGGEPLSLTDYPGRYPAVSSDDKMIAYMGRNEPKKGLSLLILPFEGERQ